MKKWSLKKSQEIEKVFSQGKSVCDGCICLQFLVRSQSIKIAVVCGKKHFVSAVARNRIKRKLRNAVEHNISSIICQANIVVVYRGSKECDQYMITHCLKNALLKARLIAPS